MGPLRVLRSGIRLARRVEALASASMIRTPLRFLAYGFLVRNRRLAVAIERLGTASAYEGRMLLRSMLEIMINHAWIRLRQKHSRSLRFVAYQPLELLRVHASMQASMSPADYERARRNLERQRRAVRHLFRLRDRNGKMQWARSWAAVSSVEGRIQEVKSSETPGQPDPFLYAMYSWISSAVHGGPNSLLKEVFDRRAGVLVAKRQPERDPSAQFAAAAAILSYTINAAAEDLRIKKIIGSDAAKYTVAVQKLRGRKRGPAGKPAS